MRDPVVSGRLHSSPLVTSRRNTPNPRVVVVAVVGTVVAIGTLWLVRTHINVAPIRPLTPVGPTLGPTPDSRRGEGTVRAVQADEATDFLLEKLTTATGEEAIQTTEALQSRARRKAGSLSGHEKAVSRNLYSDDPNLVAATSDLLAAMGTDAALSMLTEAWAPVVAKMGFAPAHFSAWASEPVYYWLLSRIAKFNNHKAVKFLISIAEDRQAAIAMRGVAFQQLVYCPYRQKRSLYEAAVIAATKEVASSNDKKAAAGAVAFLGNS